MGQEKEGHFPYTKLRRVKHTSRSLTCNYAYTCEHLWGHFRTLSQKLKSDLVCGKSLLGAIEQKSGQVGEAALENGQQ